MHNVFVIQLDINFVYFLHRHLGEGHKPCGLFWNKLSLGQFDNFTLSRTLFSLGLKRNLYNDERTFFNVELFFFNPNYGGQVADLNLCIKHEGIACKI